MTHRTQIEDVKDYLYGDDGEAEEDDSEAGSPSDNVDEPFAYSSATDLDMMVGYSRVQTKAQLLDAMPERAVVDRLIAEWFNSADPFLREF